MVHAPPIKHSSPTSRHAVVSAPSITTRQINGTNNARLPIAIVRRPHICGEFPLVLTGFDRHRHVLVTRCAVGDFSEAVEENEAAHASAYIEEYRNISDDFERVQRALGILMCNVEILGIAEEEQ